VITTDNDYGILTLTTSRGILFHAGISALEKISLVYIWTGHVLFVLGEWNGWAMYHTREWWETYTKLWSETLKGRHHLEDLGVIEGDVMIHLRETGW